MVGLRVKFGQNPFPTRNIGQNPVPTLNLEVYALILRVSLIPTRKSVPTHKSDPTRKSALTRKLQESTLKLHQRSTPRVTVTQYFPSLDKLVEYFDFGYLSNLDKFERIVWLFNLTHKPKLTRKEKTYA